MSHFYLYPLLLSQGYQPFQIQQILHSFGLLSNSSLSNHSIFYPPLQESINKHHFSRNLIIQQNHVACINSKGSNQAANSQEENKNPIEQDLIKSENLQSEEKTQEREEKDKSDQKSAYGCKNRKKKRIAKMTLKEKRQKQMKRNQTENSSRNVIPNEIHQMLSILFKKKKSTHLVQSLITKYSKLYRNSTLTVQRFYLYQSLLKDKINHYANQHTLKVLLQLLEPAFRIYSKQEQSIYCRIGLSLISHFLNNEATLVILNSKRIKPENKLEHLKTKRYLAYVMNQLIESHTQSLTPQ